MQRTQPSGDEWDSEREQIGAVLSESVLCAPSARPLSETASHRDGDI